jgi:hypothetical protein
MSEIKLIEDFYSFECPNCNLEIIVGKNELNCHIFRHAYYKNNFQQVNPHLSFEECQKLIENDLVFGCCKPFEIIYKNNQMLAVKCEYK